MPDEKWGNRVVLYIEGKAHIADLSLMLGSVLDKTEIPKEIVYIDRFEQTSSGKIIRIRPET